MEILEVVVVLVETKVDLEVLVVVVVVLEETKEGHLFQILKYQHHVYTKCIIQQGLFNSFTFSLKTRGFYYIAQGYSRKKCMGGLDGT
jgi:hypothetical protein